MPRIATYEAKDLKLTPSDKGYSAEEMAGRRIGPFYSQAGEAAAKVGRLQEQELDLEGKEITSFLRFQGLYDRSEGGGGVKYGGGLKGMDQLAAGGREPNYAALNEMANGAVGMSRLARNLVNNPQTGCHQKYINDVEGDNGGGGVSVLRGGASGDKSDLENGVTVLRGSSKLAQGTPDATEKLLGMPTPPPASTAAKIYAPGNNMSPMGDDSKAGGYGQSDMSPFAQNLPTGGDVEHQPLEGYSYGQSINEDLTIPDSRVAGWPTTSVGPPQQSGMIDPWPDTMQMPWSQAPVNDSAPINQDGAPQLWGDMGDGM